MSPINASQIIIQNGDYHSGSPRHASRAGRPISVELSGIFDGASVIPGYYSRDEIPAFVTDVGDDGQPRPKTEAGRWVTALPSSGRIAVRVENAGPNTAIRIDIQDLLPR